MVNRRRSLPRRLIDLAFNPHRFNDTAAYHLYLRLRHPTHYAVIQRERAFYQDLIQQVGGGLVFDVGANGGAKGIIFAEVADRVVCVEPSPAAVHVLQERFAKFTTVSIVGQGAGPRPGSFPFHMFSDTDCYNTFSSKWADALSRSDGDSRPVKEVEAIVDVSVTTLDRLIDQFGTPSYIKIDVEGFEFEVLKGLTRPVKLVSIECKLPEFENETLECLTRLEDIQCEAKFNYCTNEPPSKFASDNWLSRSQMAQVVTDRSHRFMEIYSKAELP